MIDTLTSARIVLGNRQAKAAEDCTPDDLAQATAHAEEILARGDLYELLVYAAMRNPPVDDSSSRPQ